MANEEHLKWLKEGVEAWNKRRVEKFFKPNLRDANLTGADLTGAVLTLTNLRRANLGGANLTSAFLTEANLRDVNFTRTILHGADLLGANLMGANVRTVYSALDKKDHTTAEYTDLSRTLELKQSQLDSMIGDSGTIVPDHLTRPDHWEVLPWHREDAGQDDPETDVALEDVSHDAPTEKPRAYYQQLALNLTREPIKSATVLAAYGQQLATAAKMYRDANKVNQLPDDLILVEQIGVMFGALSTIILKQQADSAATIEGLETKIAELEKQLYQLKGELNAVKNSQSEKTPKESGFISTFSTNFTKGFGVTLGTGVAVGIVAGATYIFGDGEDIAQKLVDAFNGLFSGPAEAQFVPPQDGFDA